MANASTGDTNQPSAFNTTRRLRRSSHLPKASARSFAFTEGIREIIRSHPYTRKDYFQVWFNGMGPSSLDILLYVFHEVPDWSTELRERERMPLDIMRLANQLGVEFAFPTETHLVKQLSDTAQMAGDPVDTDKQKT